MPWRASSATTSGTSGRSSSRMPIDAERLAVARRRPRRSCPRPPSSAGAAVSVPASIQRGLADAHCDAGHDAGRRPRPGCSVTSSARGGVRSGGEDRGGERMRAARPPAPPPGRSVSWRPSAPCAHTAATSGSLRVRVPVLSNATNRMLPKRSKAAPDLMITPNLLAEPIAEMTVTGTAIARAHGEAATSTTSARSVHVSGSPISRPSSAMSADRISTPGTSGRAIRSASRARSPFRACACSTSAHDRGERVVGAVCGGLDLQRAGAVDRRRPAPGLRGRPRRGWTPR